MSNIAIELPQALSPYVLKQLRYKLFYHFPHIDEISYEEAPPRLLIRGDDRISLESFAKSVHSLIKELQIVNRTFKQEVVVYKHTSTQNEVDSGGIKLFSDGVIPVGDGSVIYKGFALQLVDKVKQLVDSLFSRLSREQVRVPSSISLVELNKINYVPSFHHHLCFVSNLDPQLDKMRAFPAAWAARGESQVPSTLNDFTATPSRALNPAVCLHIYPMLAAQRQTSFETSSWVAASGKVFRFESANHSALERLFEFTMHELINVGPELDVQENGKKIIKLFEALSEALQLDSQLVVANDMFIGERDQNRMFAQLSTQSKVELMVRLSPEDRYIAAGSLNLHGQHFTKPLGIQDPNSQTLSGSLCMGIGIERLALALASQHGARVFDILSSADVAGMIAQSGLALADNP